MPKFEITYKNSLLEIVVKVISAVCAEMAEILLRNKESVNKIMEIKEKEE